MTLAEIENSLPNGFHDAYIHCITIDYVKREVKFSMDILVGDLSSSDEGMREDYRAALLTLSDLFFCVIEPPRQQYDYQSAKPLWVDAGSRESTQIPISSELPDLISEGAFTYWFYVNQWNAFIHVAARQAGLQWK